ncbi:MAG: DNA gyrase subunit A [Spirochaetota bacterium]
MNNTNNNSESKSKTLMLSTASRPDISDALKKGLRVIPIEVEDQMKDAYLDYAMSVIVGRALPDVRDGLKPVHRRILHAMNERAWRSDRPYVKCAKIVGEVIGNYHPHGDTAVYDTLVRMVQDFSLRVPLIDGQGNFGSVDGDNPAAYRYTEAKLAKVAEELLRDIGKDTVDFSPNFDDTKQQPNVLPANFPNLLVNGTAGIAVGMATNIPPHNLSETINAVIELIRNPEITIPEILKILPGPDFPTGGITIGGEGLLSAYSKGRGSIILRAKTEIEENKKGREVIVITEVPYQVNKKHMLEKIGDLVNDKTIEGISEILDLSNRKGIRVEIHIKKDYNSQVILNQLFKLTQLQVSYGIIMLAILDNKPKIFNIKEILQAYATHRNDVVVRRTQYELKKAKEREHILQGLKIALDNIDEVIRIIRASTNPEQAKNGLMQTFTLSEIQANAILEMRLQRLTSLEVQKIINELEEIRKQILDLQDILDKPERVNSIVCEELSGVATKYGNPRRTEISLESIQSSSFNALDLIADEDVFIQISQDQFIKRMPLDTFRKQRRGGRGVQGASSSRNDSFPVLMRIVSTHDDIMFFSNKGRAYKLKVYELPVASKEARGKSLKAILNLSADETITSLCAFKSMEKAFLLMATSRGIIKKTLLKNFSNTKKSGIIAINLKDDDELIYVDLVTDENEVVLASKKGLALRIGISEVRDQGRNAGGVTGLRLAEDDRLVGVCRATEGHSMLVITEQGYGKKTSFTEFSKKGRGGKGMTYVKVGEKVGDSVGIAAIQDEDEIIVSAQSAMIIRIQSSDISTIGRVTSGVKLVNLRDNDLVQSFAIIPA